METENLLLRCQVKLEAKTEYALAKGLGISTQRVYDYMSGKRAPNNLALVKIAKCLEMNPIELIAQFEELNAKNENEREFWKAYIEEQKNNLNAQYNRLILNSLQPVKGSGETES